MTKELNECSVEFAKDAHANLQDMVKVADAKATSLVALQALVLVLLGSSLGQDVTKAIREGGKEGFVLAGFGLLMLLSTALSSWLCLLVLLPRSAKHLSAPAGARGLLWIDAINEYRASPEAYVTALRAVSPQERLADVAYENLKIAWILEQKFRFLRKAGPFVAWSFLTWILLIFAAVVASPVSVVAP